MPQLLRRSSILPTRIGTKATHFEQCLQNISLSISSGRVEITSIKGVIIVFVFEYRRNYLRDGNDSVQDECPAYDGYGSAHRVSVFFFLVGAILYRSRKFDSSRSRLLFFRVFLSSPGRNDVGITT